MPLTFTVSRKVLYVLGGLVVVVLAGVLGAVIGGGAGSDTSTTTVVRTVTAGAAEDAQDAVDAIEDEEGKEESIASGSEDTCDELGINSEVGKEGSCIDDGKNYVVADMGSTLKLRELNAKLLGMETAKTITGEYGESKTANGVYVIFNLEITNKLSSPARFDSFQEQTALLLGENEYTEDFDVENYALDSSFLNLYDEIQPDTSQSGTVAFDVPKKLVPDLYKTGNLFILNFSDEGEEGEITQYGLFRTYQ